MLHDNKFDQSDSIEVARDRGMPDQPTRVVILKMSPHKLSSLMTENEAVPAAMFAPAAGGSPSTESLATHEAWGADRGPRSIPSRGTDRTASTSPLAVSATKKKPSSSLEKPPRDRRRGSAGHTVNTPPPTRPLGDPAATLMDALMDNGGRDEQQ